MIKQLLVISLSVALVLAGPGTDVVCNGNTNDVASCGPAGGSTWQAGATSGSRIADCSTLSASLSGIFDTLCASCQSTNVYAKSTQDGCVSTATVGANVACVQSGSCSCGNAPTPAFKWNKVDSTNCQIASCLAAPMPTSSLTDQFCASCGKTNTYANSYGTACVNPSASCTRKTGWTDSDCKVCNASGTNSSNIYASADKTSCTTTAPSSSSSSVIAFSSLIIASLLL